ncbi:uncharacterized protein LOC119635767 [Glossina fuscipes]|uniref:Uncharacterized protein LOC119635767 n=1 Tax=Glossina fuscipes TaxID=7396 RepID=A0A8U0WL80_9MUSC|nr:uncharacterized protein LOC119635767 [Glossina fuscipes]
MSRRFVPPCEPYRPPPQIQELLDRQAEKRKLKRTAQLPKRNWIQRNPRLFQIGFITTSMLILFSKPLYDIFIAEPIQEPKFKKDGNGVRAQSQPTSA